jgi:hypothetical protein
MTCAELHALFESDLRAVIDLAHKDAECSEHIAKCPDCGQFMEEQKDLAKCLLVMRDTAPAVPASLDASVLARYRVDRIEHSRSVAAIPSARPISRQRAFRWTAAATFAAVIALGAIVLFIPRRHTVPNAALTERPRITAQVPLPANASAAVATRPLRRKPKSAAGFMKRANPTMLAARSDNPIPAGFQSLMYCDPLSCPDAMDVIRVELPSPAFGLHTVSPNSHGVVFADILVGSDGIARGIRVVE